MLYAFIENVKVTNYTCLPIVCDKGTLQGGLFTTLFKGRVKQEMNSYGRKQTVVTSQVMFSSEHCHRITAVLFS